MNCSVFSLLVIASVISGCLTHVAILKKGEWHLKAPLLFQLTTLLALIPLSVSFIAGQHAAIFPLVLCTTYLASILTSIVIYRTCFHSLRQFNGPSMAGVTKLWHAMQCSSSQNHLVLQKLHRAYGDFVRTGISLVSSLGLLAHASLGPNELTVFDP